MYEGAASSDDECDFRGWEEFPGPGQAVHQEVSEPVVQLPSTSAQSASDVPAAPLTSSVPEGLFSQEKSPNWDPPHDLLSMCR